jgi:hypothetical protein
MFGEIGEKVTMFCTHCKRLWIAEFVRVCDSRESFDKGNFKVCPWCDHQSESIAARPEHEKLAVNNYATLRGERIR